MLAIIISTFFFHAHGLALNCMNSIPKKIWQTYQTKDLPKEAREAQTTWLSKNPNYIYALWDDNDIEAYIIQVWGKEMHAFFKALPLGVMKADLWRYLIITTEGGVYADVDSICCQPIRKWASFKLNRKEPILLLGMECDEHFCQWTIAATPNHPAMKYVSNYILEFWKKNGIDLTNPHFVHQSTGPGVWTRAIIAYLGQPSHAQAKDIFDRYQEDTIFRSKVNKLGIYLYPATFYSGEVSKNLYGSLTFGDGYKHWGDERRDLVEQIK